MTVAGNDAAVSGTRLHLHLLGAVILLGAGLAWAQLDHTTATHHTIRALSVYSPSLFAHGAVWTLPLSALLIGPIPQTSLVVTFFACVAVPYVFFAGARRWFVVFIISHLVATSTAFVLIATGHVLGSARADRLWTIKDFGASAGLCGVAGALFVLLCSQRRFLALRIIGTFVAAAATAFFLHRMITYHHALFPIVDVEHLLAGTVGAVLEAWYLSRHADAYCDTVLAPPRFGGAHREQRAWSDRNEARLIGVLVALSGVLAIVSALTHAMPSRLAELQRDLSPLAPHVHRAAAAAAALGGLAVILVARGLVRRRALSWWLTLGLLVVIGLAHLLKGFDIEEFTITVSIIAVLVQAHRLYRGPIHRAPWGRFGSIALVGAAMALGYGFGGMLIRRDEVQPGLTLGRGLEQIASNLVGLQGPLRFGGHFGTWFPATLTAIGVVWLFALGVALFAPLRHRRATVEERTRVARLVARRDSGTLDPFALRRDRSYIFDPSGSGAVAFRVLGGVALVGGDQLGETDAADDAVGCFVRRCDEEGWRPAAIGVAESRLGPWRDAGLRGICLGDEALIATGSFTLDGRTMRPVRQAVNRTKNHGVTARLVHEGELDDQMREALLAIDAADRGREQERGFSMTLDGLLTNPTRATQGASS